MNRNVKQLSPRALCESKYNSARMNLLLVLGMTLINIVVCCLGSDRYFLFSASIPYYLVLMGALWTGRLPDEYYAEWPSSEPFLGISFLIVMLVIALIILLVYLCCFLLSKKNKVGWLLAAAVFFGIDTIGMLLLYGISADAIFDIVFHAWVLYYLIVGTINGYKLKKLPEDEPEPAEGEAVEVPAVEVEVPTVPEENKDDKNE